MKKFLSLTVALAGLLLAGCGAGAEPAPSSSAGPQDRTVTDQYGTVTISGTPARVVTPGNSETDTALALGVVPVAMGAWFGEADGASPWRRELLAGNKPELIQYNPAGYDVEETLAFRPDLVLAGFDLEENPYRKLAAVVPTVSMPYEISATDFTRALGTALGRQVEAETLIQQTDAALETARTANSVLDGKTVAVVDSGSPGVLADATRSTIGLGMPEKLGLKPAPGTAGLDDYAEIPAERWSIFDGDLLLVNAPDAAAARQLEANALFKRIPAVAAGNYLIVDNSNDFELLRSTSMPQVQYALRTIVPRIAEIA